MKEAGSLLVEILENQKVERVFCVPGESYLSVMNGLQDTSIETVLCKHEGAASIMAEADGKLTGRPGIALLQEDLELLMQLQAYILLNKIVLL